MCTLDEYVMNEGIMIGEARGEARGIMIGEEKGTETTMLANLKNLMKKLNVGLKEAMNLLDVSEEDKKKYSELMTNQEL